MLAFRNTELRFGRRWFAVDEGFIIVLHQPQRRAYGTISFDFRGLMDVGGVVLVMVIELTANTSLAIQLRDRLLREG